MNLCIITPHFTPDVAPTGTVITRIVEELARRGHTIEVITSLPWYREHRLEPGYTGRLIRKETKPWGHILRLHPFPASDKRDIVRRAASFAGFSTLAAAMGMRGPRMDAVLAVSPPLTLGLDGWLVARARKAPFVFNIQDVFPDIAIELGVLKNERLISAAHRLERFCYARAEAVTVLSEDLKENLARKISDPSKIHVIPNFVDTERIRPLQGENDYRREFGLEGKTVVMYAGNVGLSQSLDLMVAAAAALEHEPDVAFVINGRGAMRDDLEERAKGMRNIVFVDPQPIERLPEVLAAGDIHVVPLKRGLARSSVPSKTYSILAAGRPVVASVDAGSEIDRLLDRAGAGVSVPPEDPEAFTKSIRALLDAPEERIEMGRRGRAFVEGWASPAAIAETYEGLFRSLASEELRHPAP